jgi:hypothetical protein
MCVIPAPTDTFRDRDFINLLNLSPEKVLDEAGLMPKVVEHYSLHLFEGYAIKKIPFEKKIHNITGRNNHLAN